VSSLLSREQGEAVKERKGRGEFRLILGGKRMSVMSISMQKEERRRRKGDAFRAWTGEEEGGRCGSAGKGEKER